MRGLWWLLVFLFVTTGPARAQQVTLTVPDFPHCWIQGHRAGEASWKTLNRQNDSYAVLALPVHPETWDFHARGAANFFQEFEGDLKAQMIYRGMALQTLDIPVHAQMRVGNVMAVSVGGIAALCLAVVLLLRQRVRTASARAQQAERLADEARRTLEEGVPQHIGAYRVTGRLGTGGMANVYRGEDAQGHPVAIKVPLSPLLEAPDLRARFIREMRLGATLQHPSVVRIEAVSMPDEYPPYIVMELVPGKPLDEPEAPQPVPETLELGARILDALAYVHGRGIVHRDLKPSNIMMTPNGPKLMDFGVARQEQGTQLTASGQILGTPLFMAPEQIQGRTDPRSDLYALGMILYGRLIGKVPIEGDFIAVITHKLSGNLAPIASLRPDLPPAVAAWIDRMVAPKPEHRFPTAADARDALPR